MRYDLAHGLVVGNDAGRRRVDPIANGLSVDFDLVPELDALANMGRLIVDRNTPFQNELFHL